MSEVPASCDVAVVGAGFTGLCAAWDLARAGRSVVVLEREDQPGGLAASFSPAGGGERLERFYHHWFTNDADAMGLIRELGAEDRILLRPTRTGLYFANTAYRLSSPLDLLRFRALSLVDRIRLGLLVLRARRVRDWRELEGLSAAEWLAGLCGQRVYQVVWEPLLRGKFGRVADEVSAVWFWNKLKLRGGSRGKGGAENLAYFRGGFATLVDLLADAVRAAGGTIATGQPVRSVAVEDGRLAGVRTAAGTVRARQVLLTTPLPVAADLLAELPDPGYVDGLRRIRHLANVCLVLELDRSLSSTYWMNVNDPGFPFVAVIEHTNFEPTATYNGRHIVYLSKYLAEDEALFRMEPAEALDFALPHLARMFPAFRREWVLAAHVWKARHSQPLVERHYSRLIPGLRAPLDGLFLATMAQIYPEDRGTSYAIRNGRAAAREMLRG